MGGHIDSWDTGSQTGANDDAGGFITCFESMRLLLKNGFRPKRTIRFIAWSGQEWGDPKNGANAYVEYHQNELKNHLIALEDDLGSTKLYGFGYSGHSQGKQILQSMADQYLVLLGAATVTQNGRAADIDPLYNLGIPTMKNMIEDTSDHRFYFTYHHSAGDTMSIMDPDDLDSNVVGIAALFYILADLEEGLPKPNIGNLRIQ